MERSRARRVLVLGALGATLALGAPAAAGEELEPTTTEPSSTAEPPSTDTTPSDTTTPIATPPDPVEPATEEPATEEPAIEEPATEPAPAEPQAPAPAAFFLAVSPSTDLVHLQEVTLSGLGFAPNATVAFAQCQAGATGPEDCDLSTAGYAQTNAAGGFTATTRVRRVLQIGFATIDCASAPGACFIGAANLSDLTVGAAAPLTFDPSVPLPPPPVVTVTPDSGLLHLQSVAVAGSGFTAGDFVQVIECLADADPYPVCAYGSFQYLQVGADGTLATSLVVTRFVRDFEGPVIDCADAPGTCILVVQSFDDPLGTALVPLDFDPSVPPPPPPVLTVDPSTDLGARTQVTVTGSGFAPGEQVYVVQCAEETGVCGSYEFVLTDASGAFSTTLWVRRFFTAGYDVSTRIDCAIEECVVEATAFDDPLGYAEVELHFDPDAPLPPPPVVTVTPSTGLANGQRVTVAGTGFTPDASVGMAQCKAGATSSSDCDLGFSQIVTADDSGSWSTLMTVRTVINVPSASPVDCAAAPGTCVIGTANLADFGEGGRVDLAFAPAPAPNGSGTPTEVGGISVVSSGGTGSGSSTLPTTGTDARPVATLGTLLLLVGVALALAGGRRRPSPLDL